MDEPQQHYTNWKKTNTKGHIFHFYEICGVVVNCLIGIGEFFWVIEIDIIVIKHCECTKCHRIFCLRMINFILHEFHLNKNENWEDV